MIDGWFIIVRKPYLDLGLWRGGFEFLKDMVFGTTFPGSWYLSASIMGVLLIYCLSSVLNKYLVFVITLFVAFYVYYVSILPKNMQIVYDWYATNLREEVSLSFPAQLVWISLGQILSQYLTRFTQHIWMPISAGIFMTVFIAQIFFNSLLLSVVMVLTLFIFCFLLELPDNKIYKRLRNYSILMFFFHFSIAGKMGLFCRYVGDTLITNWLYYIIVVMLSIVFAEIILRLEKFKYLEVLKYTH